MRLVRADTEIRRKLEVQGLSLNDLTVLQSLCSAPGRRLRRVELAESLGITPSGIARLVAPLEKLGYLSRDSDPHDARVSLVCLTEVGAALYHDAVKVAEEKATTLLGDVFDSAEQEQLTKLLGRLAPSFARRPVSGEN
ncbi:MarR family winged helix-turn-helix transcriptional regulator [Brevibacterium sp. RIT 803]|uniref:MarR family winged helix-turn-helix transcriptional regulator n=1 Tax=Brevibacterium sp. RIT 803 TaxID=2810210 RepID=UPI00195282CD|nr:MarR family winged helix-turn-helix transcriptional regulator [Brevibacterium sp. RIT 803]MBM6591600.1 winged helix-turn-helix transcriptional regulator [Brevibacterium sp. RIT 803]